MALEQRFRLCDVDETHPAMTISMPLLSEHDGDLQCIGTAFPVAPGLAITAAHVADEWRVYQQRRDGYKRAEAAFSVVAFQWCKGEIWRWVVDAMYESTAADIAFLRFRRPSWWGDGQGQVKPRCARLSFNPPRPGENVRLFGFPKSRVEDNILCVSPAECIGRVRSVDLRTDRHARPLSHFEIEGEICGGMSGGPCFDSHWNVIGVNSRGWTFSDADTQPLAYVALLWPAMNVEIDLFKSGAFPAIELFNQGPARALGYRRVQVTSKGEGRLARVDPEELVPLRLGIDARCLERVLNFAAGNAQEALGDVQSLVAIAVSEGKPLDINGVLRAVRRYFWELESALKVSLRVAALRAGLGPDIPVDWDEFVARWRSHGANEETLDELGALAFSWHGEDLFEVRTYAESLRNGDGAHLTAASSTCNDRVCAVALEPCRVRGAQVFLPDGLNRFLETSRRFVQRLLRLTQAISRS